MALRVIPKRTKVKMEIFKGVTLGDVFYALFCFGIFIAFLYANFPYHIFIGLGVTLLLAIMIVRNNGVRLYSNIGWLFRFISFKKKYVAQTKRGPGNMKMLCPYVGIVETEMWGDFIDYKDYSAKVIEIMPINLHLLTEEKQDMIINSFANGLRRISQGQFAQLIKLNKPLVLDSLLEVEDAREDAIIEDAKRGMFTEKELLARDAIFVQRRKIVDFYNAESKVYKEHYYMVIYGRDKQSLYNTTMGAVQSMSSTSTPVGTKVLNTKEICVFLKANYGKDFDEREINELTPQEYIDWILPKKIKFGALKAEIDGVSHNFMTVRDYPLTVGNAWGLALTKVDHARVVVNFKPVGKAEAERMIDKSIIEMETQMLYSAKLSSKIDKETALDTMKELLVSLKNENEQLFDCTIHVSCEQEHKREVKAVLRENNFKYNDMFCRQIDGFIAANVSQKETAPEVIRGMQTTTLAGFFPFVSSDLQDEGGIYLGYGESPVFINFFKRDHNRQNSNMVIIGRSGSGKTFAALTLLTNLAADDSKIFILDPEYEYKDLCQNLAGKIVDVGNGSKARFNPFHVFMDLEDEENAESQSASTFETHLQFLEEFFRLVLDGISPDAMETLNTVVAQLYKMKGITTKTNFKTLRPENYPTFDELHDLVSRKLARSKDEYERANLKSVLNYVTKFATGGRNAGLWNGPSSIESDENMVLFSFQSLLANRNKQIAAAQMLLVFKYLNNEIIKNREFNDKYRQGMSESHKRKIIVVVDEAHVFINPKYPIALDFMFDMAKRIRKYNGMQVIITQNIKDFMGSEDMIRQSSAIIAASQYSLIFSLAPNDVTELVTLYKNAGEINATEQEQIRTAGRGTCFFISGNMERTSLYIDAPDEIRKTFSNEYAASVGDSFLEQEQQKQEEFEKEVQQDLEEYAMESESQEVDETIAVQEDDQSSDETK